MENLILNKQMSKHNFIPQFVPYWDNKEKKAVQKILDQDYLNEHKTVREFETEFAKFVNAKYCVTVTSGTTALYLAIQAINHNHRIKKINIPNYASIFLANACLQSNIIPILNDVSSSGSMISNIKNRFIVHSNGRIGNTEMLEDCAQSISHHTKNSLSCYSFASTKHLTTAGQGGAICCDDDETFDTLTRLKDLGRNDRQKLKPMSDHFEYWGINSKFTEIQAAFGLVQLKKLPKRLKKLEKMYKVFKNELKNNKEIEFFDDEPKWYIDLKIKNPQLFIERLLKHNIQCRRFYKPLHLQPLFLKQNSKSFSKSISLYESGVWLPSTTNLSDNDLEYIIDSIKLVLKN